MNAFSFLSLQCTPEAATASTGDKAKNPTARSFVIRGPGKMALLDPLGEASLGTGHLRERWRGNRGCRQYLPSFPSVCLSVCLPSLFPSHIRCTVKGFTHAHRAPVNMSLLMCMVQERSASPGLSSAFSSVSYII